MAEVLGKNCREVDLFFRYGGDEFAILLPLTELEVGMELAETIRRRTADKTSHVTLRGEQVSVSFSIGVAAPCRYDSTEAILSRADAALYKAKRRGRNRVQCQESHPKEVLVELT